MKRRNFLATTFNGLIGTSSLNLQAGSQDKSTSLQNE